MVQLAGWLKNLVGFLLFHLWLLSGLDFSTFLDRNLGSCPFFLVQVLRVLGTQTGEELSCNEEVTFCLLNEEFGQECSLASSSLYLYNSK